MNTSKYIFESTRLGFRAWSEDDLEEFYQLNSDEEVMEYFPKTLSKTEVSALVDRLTQHYVDRGYTYYALEVIGSGEFVGMIGLADQTYETEFTPAVDIGWRLKRSAWGQGYATEGSKRCIRYAFDELDIDNIISVCTINNMRSERIMKKIGMTRIGVFDHPKLFHYPEYLRHLCYGLSKESFFK